MLLKTKYFPWMGKEGPKKGDVLVVDDDFAIRVILYNVLKKNFNTTAVSNGFEALLWLSQGNMPDVILTDISMPELDGFEFLKALSQSGLYNSIPVVVLSGHDKEKISAKILDYNNPIAFVRKPFDPLKIQNHITQVLRSNHLHVS